MSPQKKASQFEVKSAKLLGNFVAYCMGHPEESFWKALANWAGYKHIIASDECPVYNNQLDTFYWEGKRGDEEKSSG